MPSTVSSVVSRPFASSTVITPSLPTFSIASAMILPISGSLFAEIVPTWAISFRPLLGAETRFNSSTTNSTALSMPRFSDIGLAPAVTDFRPSRKIACTTTATVLAQAIFREGLKSVSAGDRLRQHRSGGGAVPGDIGGLGRHFLHHLGAHVLDRVFELDLLRDGDPVLGDRREGDRARRLDRE